MVLITKCGKCGRNIRLETQLRCMTSGAVHKLTILILECEACRNTVVWSSIPTQVARIGRKNKKDAPPPLKA